MTNGKHEKSAKTEHTPEPWRVEIGEQPETIALLCTSGFAHFELVSDSPLGDISADARRIVACVNACAGIPTDDLEHGDIAKALKIFALDSATFRRQRDELLAALERLSFAAMCRDSTMGDPCRLIEVRAELAAANKQACVTIDSIRGSAA